MVQLENGALISVPLQLVPLPKICPCPHQVCLRQWYVLLLSVTYCEWWKHRNSLLRRLE